MGRPLSDAGHLVGTDRSQLVAGYVGQPAIRVRQVVEKALGGVLLVDEAYAPARAGFGNARLARKLFEAAVARQASRLVAMKDPTGEELMRLTAGDVAPLGPPA